LHDGFRCHLVSLFLRSQLWRDPRSQKTGKSSLLADFDCDAQTEFVHALEGVVGATVGVSRVCNEVAPFGGAQGEIHRASTCCTASEGECGKLGLQRFKWTEALLKIGSINTRGDEAPGFTRAEIDISKRLVPSELVPRVYAELRSPVTLAGKSYKSDAILMEVIRGQSFIEFIASETGLWHSYYPTTTDANASAVVSEFNCLMKKALDAYEKLARMGVSHGDYHMGNIMVVSGTSIGGCPEILVSPNNS
jgi:hypothetical protein